jgi:hypothetical protein
LLLTVRARSWCTSPPPPPIAPSLLSASLGAARVAIELLAALPSRALLDLNVPSVSARRD